MNLKTLNMLPGATHFVPEDESETRLPFSLAVEANGLLFVSGQASVDESGVIVSGTFEEEFHRTMENLRSVLENAGSSLERVVQVRAYVREAQNVPLYNRMYREVFKAPFPARTTITNCLPSVIQFEIECIALVNADKKSAS